MPAIPHRCGRVVALALGLLVGPVHLPAAEVEGVKVEESVSIAGRNLTLNGAGLRSKFFVRVYVGALYLGDRTTDAERAIALPGPKRVRLHMLYDELSREQVTEAWTDGFDANLPDDQRSALASRIDAFNALWPALREGDRVDLDYDGEGATQITINGNRLGTIQGEDFNQAMLRIWLGEEPADDDLKRGMLGR